MNSIRSTALALGALGSTAVAFAQAGAIAPSASRAAVLTRIEAVVAASTLPPQTFAELKDPFHPPLADLRDNTPAAKDPAVVPASQRSEADLVVILAGKLQPTGAVVLGGESILLFGEKRQKKGDKLTLAHEGVEYQIEIVNIENNQFRIRYRNEELTRPVK